MERAFSRSTGGCGRQLGGQQRGLDLQAHQDAAEFVVDVAGDALALLLLGGLEVEGQFRQLLARRAQRRLGFLVDA